jgi:hypothetical protein
MRKPKREANMESEHKIDVGLYIVLTIVTCGFFNLYWNYRQMQACNELVGRQEFDFWLWFLLVFVTCGIYHIYYQYKMGSVIVEIQRAKHGPVFDNLPVLSLLVTICGLSIVVDAIHQLEINKIVD